MSDPTPSQPLTHIDIGDSPAMAAAQATEPYAEFLCGADTASGNSIRDSLLAIEQYGNYPAATTCSRCQFATALIGRGVPLKKARQLTLTKEKKQ